MPRCSNCGRDNPQGSLFCLNCGTQLGPAPDPTYRTVQDGSGLPGVVRCSRCGSENPTGMNFCRNCGNTIQGPPSRPVPATAPVTVPVSPTHSMPPPSDVVGAPQGKGNARSASPSQSCPNCGGQTPSGFAFCQQCGQRMPGAIGPGTERRQSVIAGETGGTLPDAMAPTLAANGGQPVVDAMAGTEPGVPPNPVVAGAVASPPAFGAEWGHLITVNKDGSDGQRHSLSGDWVVVGRGAVDIPFADDRFLAPEHARLEQTADGCAVVPLDTLNGVYRQVDGPTWLADGAIVLLGREVLRFELVEDEERLAPPLLRHGTALFGSPLREPWGRLIELMASGGVRDVRHLAQETVVVGREEGDILFPDDAFLSRRHAAFSWRDGRCALDDLRSSNGTFVRLSGRLPLKSGDHLRIGDQLLRVELAR